VPAAGHGEISSTLSRSFALAAPVVSARLRPPRSAISPNPMVSSCCEIFLLCAAVTMLTFFIAGLLCAQSTSITWDRHDAFQATARQ
jgi:hypothetical protein